MIKFLNACLVFAVLCSGFILYSLEHLKRGSAREITVLQRKIDSEKEDMKLLVAEWSSLMRPERLQKLALQKLDMQRIEARQIVSIDDLSSRVPPEPMIKLEEQGKDPIGDILLKLQ
jgi:cell division protein FtsL